MTRSKVGIKALELYFPSVSINQNDLEVADDCIGKYTIGLGQNSMAVCTDIEDINSICLTVTKNLLNNYNINPCSIGFLQVGTETIIDKSKSTKSVLMQLFECCGNTDIAGVDVKNACFGGTSALFNGLDWLESSNWDGRYALIIAADIAVYGDKITRCTGGAGAVAMLLSGYENEVCLAFDCGVRSHFMSHQWDFYKPRMASEYPVVDGAHSIDCYQTALNNCFELFCKKAEKHNIYPTSSSLITTDDLNYFCFHAPFARLVEKSFAKLFLIDLKSHPDIWEKYELDDHLKSFLHNKSNKLDKDMEKSSLKLVKEYLKSKVDPTLFYSRNLGNTYTASLYSCLISLLTQQSWSQLSSHRVIMFSYGSGLASCMFSLEITDNKQLIQPILDRLAQIKVQLSQRKLLLPQQFVDILEQRTLVDSHNNVCPQSDCKDLFSGTYYLTNIDDRYRRHYKITDGQMKGVSLLL